MDVFLCLFLFYFILFSVFVVTKIVIFWILLNKDIILMEIFPTILQKLLFCIPLSV